MEDIRNYKEVYFHEYCPKCVFKDTEEVEDPCNECLISFVNENSHKPVKFVEKQ